MEDALADQVVEELIASYDYDAMSIMERIAILPEADRDAMVASLTPAQLADARMWLRPGQLRVLDDPAPVVLDARGRGAGKTRVGSSKTIEKARTPGTRIHLIGRTVGDVRDVMVQGESGILALSPPDFVPEYTPSVRRLAWPNGSVAMTFSADAPDQLRGPQCEFSWCDELAAWKGKPDSSGATAWDNVLISTRLGVAPQVLVTTTPRRVSVIRKLIQQAKSEPARVSMHVGSTLENAANLAPEYVKNLLALYAGTALEQQEIFGVMLDEVAGALWRDSDFNDFAYLEEYEHGDLVTVIGVDPGVTTGGDATGIITVRGTTDRLMSDRQVFVVADDTEPGLSPERWAARVVEVWRRETEITGRPAIVVAEKNQGGELVSTVIKQSTGGEKIPVGLIHAKGSKAARAEPVVLAYRKHKVWHSPSNEGDLDELQSEQTTWEPDVGGWSPNRLDALVHAARAVIVNDEILRQFGAIRIVPTEGSLRTPGYRREDRASPSMGLSHRRGRERF